MLFYRFNYTKQPTVLDGVIFNIADFDDFVTFVYEARKQDNHIYVLNLKFWKPEIIKLIKSHQGVAKPDKPRSKVLYKLVIDESAKENDYELHLKNIDSKKNHLVLKDLNLVFGEKREFLDFSKEEIVDRLNAIQRVCDKINNGKIPDRPSSIVAKKLEKLDNTNQITYGMYYQKDADIFKKYKHGGIIVSNPKNCKKELKNVYYADINSAYPSQLKYNIYPLSRPYAISEETFKAYYKNPNFLSLVCIDVKSIKNTKLTITGLDVKLGLNYLTNLDLLIIEDNCDVEYEFVQAYTYMNKGMLPRELPQVFENIYKVKQQLKAQKGTPDFDKFAYAYIKVIINSTTGLLGKTDVQWYHRYINHHWNIFMTAHQRYDLYQHIKALGDNFVYSNTDSIYSLTPCNTLIEGVELGQVEKEMVDLVIVKGNSKIMTIKKDNVEFIINGPIKDGLYGFLNTVGLDYVKRMFLGVIESDEYNIIPACYGAKRDYRTVTEGILQINRSCRI